MDTVELEAQADRRTGRMCRTCSEMEYNLVLFFEHCKYRYARRRTLDHAYWPGTTLRWFDHFYGSLCFSLPLYCG